MIEADLGTAAFWLLLGIGALSGMVSVQVFQRWSDAGRLRPAVNRVLAHLFEFHLFANEPRLILRAQRDLIVANMQVLQLVAIPSLILALPFAILLAGADAFFGRAPLKPGEATVVTVQCGSRAGISGCPAMELSAPAGMKVETPPVRVPGEHQVSWRVRPIRASSGELKIRCDGRTVGKSISAEPGLHWLSEKRTRGRSALLAPLEMPVTDPDIESITVLYPPAKVFGIHWLVWFFLGSLLGAAGFLLKPLAIGKRRSRADLRHYRMAALMALGMLPLPSWGLHACADCHPKEVAGYSATAMAHSLSPPQHLPSGSFLHSVSGTRFTIRSDDVRTIQQVERHGASADHQVAYIIGSGSHAFGFLVQVGDRLFQSPVSYYTNRKIWDMAPGYEDDRRPDFDRPITPECLFCHAGTAKPIPGTLNRYETPPFTADGITCERCHGPADAHLRSPVPGSIINPGKLPARARDSICEQCHLSGEARITNPGKPLSDFHPGQNLEDVFSVYLSEGSRDPSRPRPLKVISQAQQLALSTCARMSQGKMWCGTCHNPHETPADAKSYFRARCLGCHGSALVSTHPKPTDDCIGCHMPRRPVTDGGHTVFTDHRIARVPQPDADTNEQPQALTAWHDPPEALAKRNLGLAYIDVGRKSQSADYMYRGYRLLVACQPAFPNDPAVLTGIGLVLLGTHHGAEAAATFERTARLEPSNAEHYLDEGFAWKEAGNQIKAVESFENALRIDPLLKQAYDGLAGIYLQAHEPAKVRETFERCLKASPGSIEAQVAIRAIAGRP